MGNRERDAPAHLALVAHVFELVGLCDVAQRLRAPSTEGRRALRDRAYLYIWGLPAALLIATALGLVSSDRGPGGGGTGLLVIPLLVFGFLVTAAGALLALVLEEWRLLALWVGGVVVLLGPIPERAVFGAVWSVAAAALTIWWLVSVRRRGGP